MSLIYLGIFQYLQKIRSFIVSTLVKLSVEQAGRPSPLMSPIVKKTGTCDMISKSVLKDGKPSRTAETTAMLRAAHQLLDDPTVLYDPLALRILGPTLEADLRADPFQYNDSFRRSLRGHFAIRNRFVEDEVLRGMTSGIQQYVLLGAGLDTFAYRSPHLRKGLRVFELDHPSTQQWKRQRLAEAEIDLPEGLSFVSLDIEDGNLGRSLTEAGFDVGRPACFSWLGVTPYLSDEAIMETLRFVVTLPRGSSITFDFRFRSSDPVERAIDHEAQEMVSALGEPFVSIFDPSDLRRRVLAEGFGEVEAWLPQYLADRYLACRNDGLQAGSPIMCARV
jgi:methyltransferase (TIGR00027 family)